VSRNDLGRSYSETLTMSATPHLTGGVPDGTEAIGSIQDNAKGSAGQCKGDNAKGSGNNAKGSGQIFLRNLT
jgi:hypothetical protein